MAGITATYISPSAFSVTTDRVSEFIAGRRVKANCDVDGFKFGTITSSLLSAGNTTVNLTASSDDLTTNLTEAWYGIIKLPIHNHTVDAGAGGVITEIPKGISFLSKSGYNSQFVVIDGILHSTSGNSAGYANHTTSRGTDNQNPFYGLDNFKEVSLPSSAAIVDVGGGYLHFAYALLEDGKLYAWGKNGTGLLGQDHSNDVPTPINVAINVTNVYSHPTNGGYPIDNTRLYIKKTDGYIYGAGYNGYGALGLDDTTTRDLFTQITDLGTTVESFWNMGSQYGCAVAQKADKSIWVAGYNGYGQLGTGDTTSLDEFTDVTSAWNASGGTLINVIGVFGRHNGTTGYSIGSMGMFFDDGTDTSLKMSGYNGHGQLGDTTTTQRTTPITPNVGAGRIAKVAGMGGLLVVNVLKEDGNLYAWGYNGYGTVGDGTVTNRTTPSIVQTDVEDIFSDGMEVNTYGSRTHSFIKKTDKQLYGCGYNQYFCLGLGHATTPIKTHTRVLMPYDEEVIGIGHFSTTGSTRTILFQTASDKLYTCGYNGNYGIIDISTVGVYVPTQIRLPIRNKSYSS